MKPFYKCADPEGNKRGGGAKKLARCFADSLTACRTNNTNGQVSISSVCCDNREKTFMTRNKGDRDKNKMSNQSDPDHVA